MSLDSICQRDPTTAEPEESVLEAAKRMEARGVGCVVVVDPQNRPVGMLTDRDIAMQLVRRRRDAQETAVREIMHDEVVTVREGAPIAQVCRKMRRDGVRRVPVVDEEHRLTGIVALDDALQSISRDLTGAAAVARAQFPDSGPGAAS